MTAMGPFDPQSSVPLLDRLKQLTHDDQPVPLDVCRALAAVIPSSQHDYLIRALFSANFDSPALSISSMKMILSFLEMSPDNRLNLLRQFLEANLLPFLTLETTSDVMSDVVSLCNLTVRLHPSLFPIYSCFCYNQLSGPNPTSAIRLVIDLSHHCDNEEFIMSVFDFGLNRALADPDQIEFTRLLLPGLCPVANPRSKLVKILHQRLLEILSGFIADPTSVLRLLVRFFATISKSLDSSDAETWRLFVEKLCLNCLYLPGAVHRKACLFLLKTSAPESWSDYVRCWEVLESQSVVEFTRAWTAVDRLLSKPSNWPWISALFSYALAHARLKPEFVQWVLTQLSLPTKFASDFAAKLFIPLACQQSWIRSIRGKLKGSVGTEKLSRDIIQFLESIYNAEDMQDRGGFLENLITYAFVKQDLAAYGAFVAPLLEFVAGQDAGERFWVDDVIIQRFRRSASLAYTPSVRIREQTAMAQIICRFGDLQRIRVNVLGAWLGVVDAAVALSLKLDNLDWIKSNCVPYCLQFLSDRSDPDSDATPYARVLSLLEGESDDFTSIVKRCLHCLCDSCRHPYVALKFCPRRSSAFVASLILESSKQTFLISALSTFMDERSDDLVASLMSLQVSMKSAAIIFQHLFRLFPSDLTLLASVQQCRDSIEMVVKNPSHSTSLELLHQYFTSMELSLSAPKLTPDFVCWMFGCPESTAMAVKCLAKALRLGSSLPNVQSLFELISHLVSSSFDDSLSDVFRIIQSLMPMLELELQTSLVRSSIDAFCSASTAVQDECVHDLFPALLPETLAFSVDFNRMLSCHFARLLSLPYRHICKACDHFCPVWIKNNSVARLYIVHIGSLSILQDAEITCNECSPRIYHVRCSVLTMYSTLTEKALADMLIDWHLKEISTILLNPNARFPLSIDAKRIVLHAQSVGFLIKSCSSESLSAFNAKIWDFLYQGLAPNARQSLEAAMVRLLVSFPNMLSNDCCTRLSSFPFQPKNRPTVEASALVVISVAILLIPREVLQDSARLSIADSLAKRCSHNAGLVRTCSQYYLAKLAEHWGSEYALSDFASNFLEYLKSSPEFVDLNRRLGPKFDEFTPLEFTSLDCSEFPIIIIDAIANSVSELLSDIKSSEDCYQNNANRKLTRQCKSSITLDQALVTVRNSASKDYQKKIEPLQKYYQDFDLEKHQRDMVEQNYRGANRDATAFPLILIASLVYKPTNLGGLARTVEIFGCQSLVVHDKRITDDPQFKTLAVTAQNWLDIQECPDEELESYLASLKSQGYTIVGLEQTVQSVSLEKMEFPKKCALLLGTEKTGIPPSLLDSVDVCVEIPQRGVIRSLNVHVSGAICVWQYVLQQMASSTNSFT